MIGYYRRNVNILNGSDTVANCLSMLHGAVDDD